MTRQEFILRLFDNGQGLSLDQIEQIENYLPETFPDGLIEDIAADMEQPTDYPGVIESALYQARYVFESNLHDCEDMLELRKTLNNILSDKVSDMQVYHLWYAVGKCE